MGMTTTVLRDNVRCRPCVHICVDTVGAMTKILSPFWNNDKPRSVFLSRATAQGMCCQVCLHDLNRNKQGKPLSAAATLLPQLGQQCPGDSSPMLSGDPGVGRHVVLHAKHEDIPCPSHRGTGLQQRCHRQTQAVAPAGKATLKTSSVRDQL